MRSKAIHRILDRTPDETKIFVRKYADLVVRINQVLKTQGISRSQLAQKLGKRPSEISKWLNGEHNLTLKTIAKLEAELSVELINIPQFVPLQEAIGAEYSFSVYRNDVSGLPDHFQPAFFEKKVGIHKVAAS